MTASLPFQALSLDLWFTTFYHTASDATGWDRARQTVLRRFLAARNGAPWSDEAIAEATGKVGSGLRVNGRSSVTTDPEAVARAVAASLGTELLGPPGAAGRALSSAGLQECPPRLNPEADALVRWLEARGIPTVLLTNSARRAASWEEFLRAREGPPFRLVLSSCDLGVAKPEPAIFLEATERLGVPAGRMLHVGDRWELDVEGARSAGCPAGLYRGLWPRYPPGLYDDLPPPRVEPPEVRLLDDLRVLQDPSLWDR